MTTMWWVLSSGNNEEIGLVATFYEYFDKLKTTWYSEVPIQYKHMSSSDDKCKMTLQKNVSLIAMSACQQYSQTMWGFVYLETNHYLSEFSIVSFIINEVVIMLLRVEIRILLMTLSLQKHTGWWTIG